MHQFAAGNSDIVFGAELDLEIAGTVPGAPPALRLNEVPAYSTNPFWLELTNTGTTAIDQAGIIVSANNDPLRQYVLPAGTIAPGAVLLLDEATMGFRPANDEKIFLFSAGKAALLDARTLTGRLRGRAAGRGDEWLYPSAATPGAPNTFVFNDSIVISEVQYNPPAIAPVAAIPPTFQTTPLIAFGDIWRYNNANEDLPAGWASAPHAAGGNWKTGASPIGNETSALPVPLATPLTGYVASTVTYYFEREFTVTAQQIASATSLEITHEIDDGAVFYLNGSELPRFGMPEGAVGPETLATGSVDNAVLNSLVIPTSFLVPGENRLSVEVHQNGTGSSDIVFGLKLDARVQLTPGVPGQPLRNSDNQWLEVANRSASPVDLSGWDFGDGIDFTFAQGTTLAAGEHACIVRDAALFSAAYPAARMLGVWNGSLSRSGEHLVLRDARKNPVDEIRFYDSGQWPEFADGGGSSMELRDLRSDNSVGNAWAASDESSRTAWKTYTYRGTAVANGGPDGQWSEFNMGMMGAGEIWIDDISVIETPDTTPVQKITDGGFNTTTSWRLRGNHRHSAIIPEPGNTGNKILRIVATGPTEHMHNQIETTLASVITTGREYQISFRARWVTGSNQLHTRLYFNRMAHVNVIDRPANPGTPSAPNSRSVTNAGPTYAGLKHSPAVPVASQAVTVSAVATDPDGIGALTLFYSVNDGAFQSTAMGSVGGGRYEGSVPGQAAGAVVQFYVRGTDVPGAISFYPALGPDSRALFKVNDNTASTSGLHNFRVITTNADRTLMHTNTEVMSNDRIECTIIDRESDIYYGAGVRLKSSERGRNQTGRVGYNIDFPSDGFYRGAHGGVAVDRSEGQAPGQRELLFDMMISNSGGPISRYYDFIKVLAPNSALTGSAVLQMARYDDVFLDTQFENGSDGSIYEYELVYYPTTATAAGAKIPEPDNVVGVGVSNLGDDPEKYRWFFLNKINREADNYAPIINYCKLFSTTGTTFENNLNATVDVDVWLRGMAYAVLSGAGDNAAAGDGHNGIYYARPDGRIIFLPHDMDFSFDTARSIFANGQCNTLCSVPARRRMYLGHLQDIITTTYNNTYMSLWTTHFAALDPAQPWSSHLSYMTTRSNSVLSQITAQIPQVNFGITTASPLSVASSSATVAGNGWVNVREIRVQGSTTPLTVTWTGNSTWTVTVPALPGQHDVVLEAVNFSGAVIGTSTISINNTTAIEPAAAANLVVSEIMYHPSAPSPAEITAGFTDADQFEYIEITNIGVATVSLTGVRFTAGIDYDFAAGATLAPGSRLIIARDRLAFLSRYPGAAASLAAGAFLNSSKLDNGGERLLFSSAAGIAIKDFSYGDSAPWPAAADGAGYSLVLIAPQTNPNHSLAVNWRSSALPGGTPGGTDAVTFAGSTGIDADSDGLNAFLEYALGTSDAAPTPGGTTVSVAPDGFITFEYTRNLAADDVIYEVQLSADMTTWQPAAFTLESETPQGNGTSKVVVRSALPAPAGRAFARLNVRSR
ncbi:MAG TPA: lamin tail domain-containing protein [Verrucomicrobiales bacterium]|nr:lamin tail domain-containing protein [Verrucomicrobiales bacterium]